MSNDKDMNNDKEQFLKEAKKRMEEDPNYQALINASDVIKESYDKLTSKLYESDKKRIDDTDYSVDLVRKWQDIEAALNDNVSGVSQEKIHSLNQRSTTKKPVKVKNKTKKFVANAAKVIAEATLVLTVATTLTMFSIDMVRKPIENVQYSTSLNSAVKNTTEDAENNLIFADLGRRNEKGKFVLNDKNTANDYRRLRLKDPKPEEIRAYSNVIGIYNFEEMDKLAQSILYTDKNGSLCNYLDMNQYYRVNGFQTNSGEASIDEFIDYTSDRLVYEYDSNTIWGVVSEPTEGVRGGRK